MRDLIVSSPLDSGPLRAFVNTRTVGIHTTADAPTILIIHSEGQQALTLRGRKCVGLLVYALGCAQAPRYSSSAFINSAIIFQSLIFQKGKVKVANTKYEQEPF